MSNTKLAPINASEEAKFSSKISLSDRQGLINREKVHKLQDGIIKALQQQATQSHADSSMLPRLLMLITNLRELSVEHRRQLTCLKGKIAFHNDLYAETFDLV